jgi:ATP-dependent Clp protease adaptor protein ClpS
MQPITKATVQVFPYQSPAVSAAGMATILIHNDDVTPYDYVINILGDLFLLSEELADHVAWTAHSKGHAVVVVRPRTEAEKLVKVAHGRARQVSYPLTFSLERD